MTPEGARNKRALDNVLALGASIRDIMVPEVWVFLQWQICDSTSGEGKQ